jgi:ubiquinone biosynthesis protein UbiJ
MTALACATLARALNGYLALDPEAGRRLSALEGRVLGIEVSGLDLRLYLAIEAGRIAVLDDIGRAPDGWLRGPPLALSRLALGGDSRAPLREGVAIIEGDTELAEALSEILRGADVDWEELLAQRTGDVFAHQAGRAARAGIGFVTQGRKVLGQALTEYLQEEARLLVTRAELAPFLDAVDALRMDADRLAARVTRLAPVVSSSGPQPR